MSLRWRTVDLDGAAPAPVAVVIDVLRAFTFEPWAFAQGITHVLAVDDVDRALAITAGLGPVALSAGERDGQPLPGFDLGNSPTSLEGRDLTGRTLVHRTSAGTQGLARTAGSGLVLAASFVNAGATTAALRAHLAAHPTDEVAFVVTGASLGRDGDEDLACAELIAARLCGDDPDPATFTARIGRSDAGRLFAPDGPDWAPPSDLALACEVDRLPLVLTATATAEPGVVRVEAR
jgi:2-phosphosulfolactate phosphatase